LGAEELYEHNVIPAEPVSDQPVPGDALPRGSR